MLKSFYRNHRSAIEKCDGLLLNNTVLERGLVVAPVIVAANTVLNSLILGISFVVITFLTLFFASFLPKRFPYTVRVILYAMMAGLIYMPTAKMLDDMFPESVFKVGIFLPLLITNSLIVTKSETRFLKKKRLAMMLDVLCHTLGFFLVIIIVGICREILGNNTFMGQAVAFPGKFTVLMLPFGGFILVGFLSAAVQRFRLYLEEAEKEADQ